MRILAKNNGSAQDEENVERLHHLKYPINLDREIERLSKLKPGEYERERKGAAERLGVRTAILDKLVKNAQPDVGHGHALVWPEPQPWPMPVAGRDLVLEIVAAFKEYVVFSDADALVCALWALHVCCYDAFTCTPRLAITAPEKRCGKTTLLDVISCIVPRPLCTTNISTAAMFRTVEAYRPTLMVDEADTFLSENEELRGILNSGHRAGRTVGDEFEPRAFSTHCPVAIAQIGKLPDTLADRSVSVFMKRRAPGEKVKRFCLGRTPDLDDVARKAMRWVSDNAAEIRRHDPDIPEAIFNRAADNWRPLLAIADIAGASIPNRARQAALEACALEEQSHSTQLLADIRDVFEETAKERAPSADLVAALVAMTDRPWGECNHGKAMTASWLARRMKSFGIRPANMRGSGGVLKGYELSDFNDAFSRYLPSSPFLAATPL
jgi:putative DNA primase/helicase